VRIGERTKLSDEFGEQGAGVADIAQVLAALDRGEDRFQQRTRIVMRTGVAPEPGEVGRSAQLKQARLLSSDDIDRLEETGLRPFAIRLRAIEPDPALNPMQLG
jgi:hypothetical protein